jgi:hypothetical protein
MSPAHPQDTGDLPVYNTQHAVLAGLQEKHFIPSLP